MSCQYGIGKDGRVEVCPTGAKPHPNDPAENLILQREWSTRQQLDTQIEREQTCYQPLVRVIPFR